MGRSRPRDESKCLVSRASIWVGWRRPPLHEAAQEQTSGRGRDEEEGREALLKDLLAEPLSEKELKIVQYVKYGFGYAACAAGSLAKVRFRASEICTSRTEKKPL